MNFEGVTKSNTPQGRLQTLRAAGMSWRVIQSENAEFRPVPVRTLWSIHKTGKVPKRWREHFGLPDVAPAPVCPDCGVVHVRGCPKAPALDARQRHRINVDAETHAYVKRAAAAAGVTMGDWIREKVRG